MITMKMNIKKFEIEFFLVRNKFKCIQKKKKFLKFQSILFFVCWNNQLYQSRLSGLNDDICLNLDPISQ